MSNEWEKFGEEIRRTVQDAVDARNFSRLNQAVSDTVSKAAENISRGLQNGGWYRDPTQGNSSQGTTYQGTTGQGTPNQGASNQRTSNQGTSNQGAFGQRTFSRSRSSERTTYQGTAGQGTGAFYQRNVHTSTVNRTTVQGTGAQLSNYNSSALYSQPTSTKVWGVLLALVGFGIGAIFILSLIGSAVSGWLDSTLMSLFLMAVFFGFGFVGVGMASKVGRFRTYVRMIQGREYCNVDEIVQRTGYARKKVVKDLKEMIRKGWFRQGHLDEKATCLMVTNGAWEQYRTLINRLRREKEEKELTEKKVQEGYSKLSPQVKKVVEEGDEYVKKIRKANDAIPGEEISKKIARMETLVDRIFDRVEQKPSAVGDIGKLMDYYLPTTIKLLEAYQELDSQPVQGENIISSKKEIEMTLDTLNTAFEMLLDDLFQDTAWDLSSDISVLHTVLAQEGLTEDGLKK